MRLLEVVQREGTVREREWQWSEVDEGSQYLVAQLRAEAHHRVGRLWGQESAGRLAQAPRGVYAAVEAILGIGRDSNCSYQASGVWCC